MDFFLSLQNVLPRFFFLSSQKTNREPGKRFIYTSSDGISGLEAFSSQPWANMFYLRNWEQAAFWTSDRNSSNVSAICLMIEATKEELWGLLAEKDHSDFGACSLLQL